MVLMDLDLDRHTPLGHEMSDARYSFPDLREPIRGFFR
jgi:hypothetical protein